MNQPTPDLKAALDAAVAPWQLLDHPFYQAWSAGTLPLEALRAYGREYGAFINQLPSGWLALGDGETAEEEMEHAELWEAFADALDTPVGPAEAPQVEALCATARTLFAAPVDALGALYAFEVQQPATAQSKLDGLKAHYALPATAETYFEVHCHNEHEAAKLLDRIEALAPTDQAQAVAACGAMSEALWHALSGIYNPTMASN